MPDDRNDKGGRKPGRSGAAKPPVIDLKARKVGEDKPPAGKGKEGKESREGNRSKPAAPQPAAGKPAAAATGTPEKGGKPDKSDKAGKSGAATKPAAGKDSKTQAGKTPDAVGKADGDIKSEKSTKAAAASEQGERQKKGRTGLKLFLGLLALGGAAGGGAWLYQQYGPEKAVHSLQQRLAAVEQKLAASERANALAGEVATLREQLQQLQKEQAALSATVRELAKDDGGDLPLKVKALQEQFAALQGLPARVEEIGQKVETLDKTVAALSEQTATVKKTLDELAAAAPAAPAATADAGADGMAPARGAAGAGAAAGVAAAIAALKLSGQQLEQKIANLAEQIDELRQGADPVRFKALEARIGKQEEALIRAQEELRALAQRAEAAAERAAQQAKAALATVEELKANPPQPKFTPPPEGVAYAALRQKVNAGEPFQTELGRLAALMPDAPGLDVLSRYSDKGVPTADQLAAQLKKIRQELAKATQPPQPPAATEDPLGALKGKLMQVVKVRRAGEVDWPKLLAGAEARLQAGGLAAVLAELAPHKDKLPEPVAQWAAQVKARLAVDKALNALADAVLQRHAETGQRK